VGSKKTPAARAKKNAASNMTGDAATFLASPAPGRTRLSYQSQQTILRQGEPASAVFYIVSGRVQVTVVSAQGKEGVVALLSKGDFVGEGCLAGQPLYLASAKTIEESSIVRIEKAAMIELLHEQQSFAEFFTAFLLSRNIQIEADLVDQLFNSSEKRLARVLLLLAQFGKDGKMETVIPKISQEVLAAKVGTTRSRINYFMNKFRDLGLIEYNGELKVHSALLNVIIHD
jgi:CRP-like cAMP-binding protein